MGDTTTRKYRERIAENVRHHRSKNNLSQGELSKMCGLHRSYVGKIERGQKSPSLETLQKIADALFLPMSALFDGSTSGDSSPSRSPSGEGPVYRAILETSAQPMAVVEADGTAVMVNSAFETSRETTREKVLGRPIWAVELPPLKEELEEWFPASGSEWSPDRTVALDRPGGTPGEGTHCRIAQLTDGHPGENRFLLEYSEPVKRRPEPPGT